jgi:hypothetical protein
VHIALQHPARRTSAGLKGGGACSASDSEDHRKAGDAIATGKAVDARLTFELSPERGNVEYSQCLRNTHWKPRKGRQRTQPRL